MANLHLWIACIIGVLAISITSAQRRVCPPRDENVECPIPPEPDACTFDENCTAGQRCCVLACNLECTAPVKSGKTECPIPIDLGLIIDGSGSISSKNWDKTKQFLANITRRFEISQKGTHVSTIVYSTNPRLLVKFNTYEGARQNPKNLEAAMLALDRKRGFTFIDKALKLADEEMFVEASGMRKDVKKIALVLTDGQQTTKRGPFTPLDIASAPLKKKGITVYSVGVGRAVNLMELVAIATSELNVEAVSNFDQLAGLVDKLAEGQCTACDKKLDIIYGIPTSTSISQGDFEEMKSFVKDSLRFVNVANDKVHVSFMPYSNSAVQSIKLDELYTQQGLENAVDSIKQGGSGFNVADCLNRASDNGFTIFGGSRPSIPKVMILLAPESTSAQAATAQAATKLKSMGVKLLTVSFGPNKDNQNLLNAISSQPKRKFSYHSPDVIGLNDETNSIISTACSSKYEKCPRIELPQADCPNAADDGCSVDSDCSQVGESCCQGAGSCKRACTPHKENCLITMDVGILIDTSDGVSSSDFEDVKTFAKSMIHELANSENDIKIGLMQYDSNARLLRDFNGIQSEQELKNAVNGMTRGGTTQRRIDLALQAARRDLFSLKGGMRQGHPRQLLVISSGQSPTSESFANAAKALDDVKVNRYAIGTNSAVDLSFLRSLASNNQNVIKVSRPEQLKGQVASIQRSLCQEKPGKCQPPSRDDGGCPSQFPKASLIACGSRNGGITAINKEDDYFCPGESKCCLTDDSCFIACRYPPRDCQGRHDLTLVLDASSAAGEDGFAKMKRFAKDFIDGFEVRSGFTHVALVTFSGTASVDLRFNSLANKQQVKDQIDALTYKGGPSRPSAALTAALNDIYTAGNGMRDQTFNKSLVIIHNGQFQDADAATQAAVSLRQKFVDVFDVAVGPGADISTVEKIVSPEPYDNAFITSSYDALAPNLRRLTERVCEGAAKLVEVVGRPGPPGLKGATGAPGLAGIRGPPGSAGAPGGPGIKGAVGPKGPRGRPGNAGPQAGIGNLQTVPGSKGPLYVPVISSGGVALGALPGEIGLPGLRGADGQPGVPGARGPPGERGMPGAPGPMGRRGSPGRDGIDGEQGPPGNEGPVGDPGPKGPIGDSGTHGMNGRKGHVGLRGVKGQKGPRGDAGDEGVTGKLGPRGKQGRTGSQGVTGPPGRMGNNGQAGNTGPLGEPGLPGPQGNTGAPGSPGAPGKAGPKGLQGPPGSTGSTGYSGESGDVGLRGIKGMAGTHGATGPFGATGAKGSTGSQGPAGAAGSAGRPGDAGARGDQGAPGIRGISGDRGVTGPRGGVGDRGKSGRLGLSGPNGAPGSRGRRGNPGPAGLPGLPGPDGDRGSPGQQGFTGPNGASGPKGSTGETGSRGPRGNKGEAGAQGNPGAPGAQGERGNRGRIGSSGKQGANGLAGPPGDDGFPGEQGAAGFPGPSGPAGFPGAKGARGLQGKVGERGVAGSPGLKGEQGPAGSAGLPGPSGEVGPSGERGETGQDGKRGIPGESGQPGSAGEDGEIGKPGAKGATGRPGDSGTRGAAGRSGEMGDPGDAGLPGNQGQQGSFGPSGERGIPGPPGEVGSVGPIGSAGPPGLNGGPGKPGPVGEQGDAGRRGAPGAAGADGARGADGDKGPSGEMGEKGPKGEKGDFGSPGPNGNRGAQGERGDTGAVGQPGYPGGVGPAGPTGARGSRGSAGGKGEQGDRGLPGAQGEDGPPGPAGSTGAKGSTGDPGPAGEQGQGGASGPFGAAGPDGADGLPGSQGRAGPQGSRGVVGDAGEPGSRGDPGPQGVSGQNGEAGGSGDVGPSGSPGAAGPPGPPGPAGSRGGVGLSGSPGPDGEMGAKGERGNPGRNGKKGAAGKTGPMGMAGAKGGRGENGPDGSQGGVGPQGYAGRNGMKGIAGARGSHGVQGVTGATGVSGPQGAKGTTGPEGAAGPTGETGARGETGERGEQGQTGERGDKGLTGDEGQKGDRGMKGEMGPPGALGKKGPTALPGKRGPQGPPGERGEVGEPGSSGVAGVRGPEGPLGVPGPPGGKGDRGARGQDGAMGPPGPPGPPGHPARTAVPADRYPSISTSTKDPNLYRSFVGANEELEVSRDSDVLTALVTLSNQVHFYKSPIGSKKFPARSCKDLRMCYGSSLKNGEYWVDPNEGIPDDAVEVYCNFETNSTCIYPSSNATEKRKWYSGPDRYQWVGKDLEGLGQIRYVPDSSQLTFLRLLSDRARQTITYHCKNSVAWYDEVSKQYEHSIKLRGDNGVELHASSSNKFKPKILKDDCRIKDGTWRQTVVEVDTHKTHRLPVNDIAVYDIGDKEEEFGVEIGPVCFS